MKSTVKCQRTHMLNVRLAEPEFEYLLKLAREDDRSMSAAMRRMLHERMKVEAGGGK